MKSKLTEKSEINLKADNLAVSVKGIVDEAITAEAKALQN